MVVISSAMQVVGADSGVLSNTQRDWIAIVGLVGLFLQMIPLIPALRISITPPADGAIAGVLGRRMKLLVMVLLASEAFSLSAWGASKNSPDTGTLIFLPFWCGQILIVAVATLFGNALIRYYDASIRAFLFFGGALSAVAATLPAAIPAYPPGNGSELARWSALPVLLFPLVPIAIGLSASLAWYILKQIFSEIVETF